MQSIHFLKSWTNYNNVEFCYIIEIGGCLTRRLLVGPFTVSSRKFLFKLLSYICFCYPVFDKYIIELKKKWWNFDFPHFARLGLRYRSQILVRCPNSDLVFQLNQNLFGLFLLSKQNCALFSVILTELVNLMLAIEKFCQWLEKKSSFRYRISTQWFATEKWQSSLKCGRKCFTNLKPFVFYTTML